MTARSPVHVLGIIEQPFRGVVERGYADCLYLARVLNAQLGRVDVLLRGEAVLVATADTREASGDSLGDRLRALLDDGVTIQVDADDLERLGVVPDALVDGVRVMAHDASTEQWLNYDAVWFL